MIQKNNPFDFGIKELKRVLSKMDMPKSEKNKTIKLYKQRLYQRVEEVKEKMEDKLLDGGYNATDTKGAVITTPERSV